jgi:hypothetical protein
MLIFQGFRLEARSHFRMLLLLLLLLPADAC